MFSVSESTLHSFTGGTSDGASPYGTALTADGSVLYGTTRTGGENGAGVLFSENANGTDYQVVYSFPTSDNPISTLTVVGTKLFGMAFGGADGMLFSINTDGTDLTDVYSFTGVSVGTGGLTLVGSTLYGTTAGSVFSINTNGTGYTVLHTFSDLDGTDPTSPVTVVGSTIYGTTSESGFYGLRGGGTVYSMTTEGDDFTVLYNFSGDLGTGGLTLDGSTLYGTTSSGGAFAGYGTIYSVDTDNGDVSTLYSFEGSGPFDPAPQNLVLVGDTLYGTTSYSGSGDYGGYVFSFDPNDDDLSTLYGFTGSAGAVLGGGLTLVGSTLYGNAEEGGTDNYGTVYSLSGAVPYITVTPSGSVADYTLGDSAVDVDSGITVSSSDADLTSAAVTISAGTVQSGDTLSFTSPVGSGITGGYSDGVLSLSGTATPAQYQQALESVTFTTTSPNTTPRSISIVATDSSDSLDSNTAAETVDVIVPAPVVTASGTAANYTAGGPAVTVDPGVTVSSDDSDLTGATVAISAGTLQTGDTLSFTSPGGSGITGSYSGGVLTLAGTATVAQYQSALQSVTFVNTTSTSTTTRSISIVADDSNSSPTTSSAAAETVDLSAPITVTGAWVENPGWGSSGTENFFGYLATNGLGNSTLGYALQTGATQLTVLPFNNINTISVQFSGAVSDIGVGSLELVGGTGGGAVAAPSVTGFTSDGDNTYSWTLSGWLGNNEYVFAIATTGSSFGTAGVSQVVDGNGAGISGTFTTGSSSFPSGNGLAGSTFDFAFNVLPGNGYQNGIINSEDAAEATDLNNDHETSAGYNPYFDFYGAGLINSADAALARANDNDRQSGITAPTAPSAQFAGSAGAGAQFTAIALGVLETGSAAASSPSAGVAGNVAQPATTPAVATSTHSLANGLAEVGTEHRRQHIAAIDEAVSELDFADEYDSIARV
ncbi:MAG TPA: choice-of-anchor tandem repeat GloVer-containing protein [Pirellulales bacterium]|nr:choice-of-anchor tandem repeat GloVer-containing protein [Pirellulales bacterium]